MTQATIWVIGDTPSDITCARAIGAQVIAVATGVYPLEELEKCKPDYLFAHFEEIQPVLSLFAPPSVTF